MRDRKLTDVQVAEIRALAKTRIKKVAIAQQYGVSPQLISTVLRHDYGGRPKRDRQVFVDPEMDTWESIARQYTAMNPDDPINGSRAKQAHDYALKQIRIYFQQQGLTEEGLLGTRPRGEHHAGSV